MVENVHHHPSQCHKGARRQGLITPLRTRPLSHRALGKVTNARMGDCSVNSYPNPKARIAARVGES